MGLFFIQVLCIIAWLLFWPSAPVQLSFIVLQEEVKSWETVIAAFEAEHPEIHIVLEPVGSKELINRSIARTSRANLTTNDLAEFYRVDTQLIAAKYDLFYMDIIWTAQFQDNLVDLNPLIQRDAVDISGFLESELQAGEINQHQYRLPMRSDIGLLYYRKDLLDLAEPPSGLDALEQTTQKLKANAQNSQGYLWQGNAYEGLVANFMEVMSSFEGAFWIDRNAQAVGLTQPETLAAAKVLRQLIQREISPEAVANYTEQSSLSAFQTGQAAFLRGWPEFRESLQGLDWGNDVAIAPPFSFSTRPAKGCRGGWGFGIPSNATHPEEAWEAIKYFTSEAAQRTFAKAGYLPSRTALFKDPAIISQYPQVPQLFDYLQQASVFRPNLREYNTASDILANALHEILRGQTPVEQAMATAQEETERLLGLSREQT